MSQLSSLSILLCNNAQTYLQQRCQAAVADKRCAHSQGAAAQPRGQPPERSTEQAGRGIVRRGSLTVRVSVGIEIGALLDDFKIGRQGTASHEAIEHLKRWGGWLERCDLCTKALGKCRARDTQRERDEKGREMRERERDRRRGRSGTDRKINRTKAIRRDSDRDSDRDRGQRATEKRDS